MGPTGEWRSTEVVAWTQHDGVGTPPPRRLRQPFTWFDGPELEPGAVIVAGVPEPREVVAVIDAEGTVGAVSRRLRGPRAEAVMPPAPASTSPA